MLHLLTELDVGLLELADLDLVALLHVRLPALALLLCGAQLGDDVVQSLVLLPYLAYLVHHQHQQRAQYRVMVRRWGRRRWLRISSLWVRNAVGRLAGESLVAVGRSGGGL